MTEEARAVEWTVQQLADRAGVSGRTLRHYHRIGLLPPDRVGANGYRHYGPVAVARLQRILLLRATGMPLPRIAELLDGERGRSGDDPGGDAAVEDAEIRALEEHRERLVHDREAVERRILAVERTLELRREGRRPPMDVMLDGFNDRFEAEVVDRWGRDAYEAANGWWHGLDVARQRAWKRDAESLLDRWRAISVAGGDAASAEAQEHAARHMSWFAAIPGTPTHDGPPEQAAAMVRGVADSYEADPDFHRSFGGEAAARLAAAALRIHLDGGAGGR
ncbi:DNA-binding transcriptional MerR regulator [Clavibacter michiganensis]|uniref:MerR family transcriptional regulator n=1 Tax=Clavibacter michiganensis TaxID=28447 RepID=UPI001E12EA47|nr:MerR family transcriptional regulator [Clavibacter michiganensis]MBP2456634.1 DNA-binding transcriptional MerR regulator [Clavibacter michiganensis]MDQ0409204.1 DNA-binding transcriptional MerR regulator [Clavibacter michiganensis]